MKRYWTFYINPETGFNQVFEARWLNDTTDSKRKKEGRIFLNEIDARNAMVRMKEIIQDRREV